MILRQWKWAVVVLAAGLGLPLTVLPWLGMRFSGQLLLSAAALGALWLWGSPYLGKTVRQILRTGLLMALGSLLAIECYVVGAGCRSIPDTPVDAVVVLGAGVNGRDPSPMLKNRLDAALRYLEAHPSVPVVLSGGKGRGEEISEAACMYAYLEARGVDAQRLLREDASTNTAENMSCSREMLEQAGIDPQESCIAVVTSDFHVGRAILTARKYDYGTVIAVPVEHPWPWLSLNYHLREAFAVVKTLILD